MNPLRVLAAVAAPFGITISAAAAIDLGAALPSVSARDHEGRELKLAETAGSGWTLVYFYPKADTPGCTKQACSLRDSFTELSERGVKVFGVSMDDVAAQKAFREKHQLPFTLLADKEGAVADAFGVPHALGFTKRQAFLFKDGKLVWRDLSASTERQAADVLEQLPE